MRVDLSTEGATGLKPGGAAKRNPRKPPRYWAALCKSAGARAEHATLSSCLQPLRGHCLVAPVLSKNRFEVLDLLPLFARAAGVSHHIQRFGVLGMMHNSLGRQFDRAFVMSNRLFFRRWRELAVNHLGERFQKRVQENHLVIPLSQDQMPEIVVRIEP